MKKILHRIYSDYFMPSRINEYEALLQKAVELKYRHLTIPEFYALVKNGALNPAERYFIHRHDIDTDTATAERFFNVEKKFNIKASYYFRLSTLDVELMRKINSFGSEAGYHFEELAQFCKDHRIKSPEEALKKYDAVRRIFQRNFLQFEKKAGFKIKSICSHGDFVNRRMGIPNYSFITPSILSDLGIELECYDLFLFNHLGTILADDSYPQPYLFRDPFSCIEEKHPVIYLLTHPRHWHIAIWENTKDNLKRAWEGIVYDF